MAHFFNLQNNLILIILMHGIIEVHATPPKILGPSPKFKSPLDTKAPGPPLIYLVKPLAILDPHINV